MLIRYPPHGKKKGKTYVLASDSSNHHALVLKQDFSRHCANDLKACNLENLLRSNTKNYSHLKILYIKAYIGKIV